MHRICRASAGCRAHCNSRPGGRLYRPRHPPSRAPEEEPVKHRNGRLRAVLASAALASISVMAAGPVAAGDKGPLGNYKHIVVIYEENHSFDNLYGHWGDVNGQHVIGSSDATAPHT